MTWLDEFLMPSAFGDVVNERMQELGIILTCTQRNMDPSQMFTQTFGRPDAPDLLRVALALLEDAKSDLEQRTGEDQVELSDAMGIIEDFLSEVDS